MYHQITYRDLKPGNIFLDKEKSVQLGDFGLATSNKEGKSMKTKPSSHAEFDADSEASSIYDAIDDISRLLGRSAFHYKSGGVSQDVSQTGESMTGGVGTTFYRVSLERAKGMDCDIVPVANFLCLKQAPEQEGQERNQRSGKGSSYTVQADIFSLGVIIFELFHPPFSTYMERAGILSKARGDHLTSGVKADSAKRSLLEQANERFPDTFVKDVPENAQQMILLCLDRDRKSKS